MRYCRPELQRRAGGRSDRVLLACRGGPHGMSRTKSSKAFPRSKRVAQQIQRTLSELIRREIRDPRLGLLTITEVRVTSDLSYATIYYSVLNAKRSEAQEVLVSAAEILRGPLGRALGLRHA